MKSDFIRDVVDISGSLPLYRMRHLYNAKQIKLYDLFMTKDMI